MNFTFQPSEENDIMHYAKGSTKNGAKYISRKKVNGKWRYYYKNIKNNFKEGYKLASNKEINHETNYEDNNITHLKRSDFKLHRANENAENRFGNYEVGGMDRYYKDNWDINKDLIRNKNITKEEKEKISKAQRLANRYDDESDKDYMKAVEQWNSKSYKLGKTIGKVKKKLKK